MKVILKAKLVSATRGEFTPEGGKLTPYWRLRFSDPDSDYPFSCGMDYHLAEKLFTGADAENKFLNHDVLATCELRRFDNGLSCKVIQLDILQK